MIKLLAILLMFTPAYSFGQMRWKSINDIPKRWIMLERDSAGYLVYKPCNGETPRIIIEKNNIIVYRQLDAPAKFRIDKCFPESGSKTFSVNCKSDEDSMVFQIDVKDQKGKLVLWTFGGEKWVMTALKFKNDFRQVGNPCHTVMKREKAFLPVQF